MRTALFALALTTLALSLAATAAGRPDAPAAIPGCAKSSLNLLQPGKLTLATDNPAFPPWWGGGETRKPWKVSNPYSGQGYESAVAYAVARQLGFAKGEVEWRAVPFAQSFRPGKKNFDWYMAQVSYTPERDKAVDFSNAYYFVNQALVGRKGTGIARARSIADLRPYRLGAQLGTTSYQYIVDFIRPSSKPLAYDTNDLAVQALKNGQIDGIVVDLPTAFYVTAVQVEDGVIVGQFPNRGGSRERFGMVFEQGNPLRRCVNKALNRLWANGTIKALQNRWLARVGGAPVLR
ncbi:MAG TPA: ABC transporter substrate-binding protein [Gaiellaceae bacterium]|jgi:polar amino acid transport system substrate-binding protein|nr:ABC transporter substrate-binding protein [Gaiellaceae bacterium]